MAELIAGLASSHAFALNDPSRWDEGRRWNREAYAKRYGAPPPEQPRVAQETDEDNQRRHARIREGYASLRRTLEEARPDVLVLVGDDQDENFSESNLPQFAIYAGKSFVARDRGTSADVHYRGHPDLARSIYRTSVESDIDLTLIGAFPEDRLRAHAFGQILGMIESDARLPVIPLFVNAIHVPAPSPSRCYTVGQTVRKAIEAHPGAERVAIYASGGLSHFTASYPWRHYDGPYGYGAIAEEFDRSLIARITSGEGHALTALTSQNLLDNGDIEFRCWMVLLGALEGARPELLVYEPFYRGIMGMAVGCWDLAK